VEEGLCGVAKITFQPHVRLSKRVLKFGSNVGHLSKYIDLNIKQVQESRPSQAAISVNGDLTTIRNTVFLLFLE
jgi:hypothetical protein